jgi:hypothetical protein
MATDYDYLLYKQDENGNQIGNADFVRYAFRATGGRIKKSALPSLYVSYAQERTNEDRKAKGLEEMEYPEWYDPTGRLSEVEQFRWYKSAVARDIGIDERKMSPLALQSLADTYKQEKQNIADVTRYIDQVALDKSRAKSLGVTYQEGMAFPAWDTASSLAKYYTYDNTEEDQTRKGLGLPPVSYTDEFTGPEGKAAMLAGDMPASVQYTKNLLDAYDAFTQDVETLAKAGQLNDESYAAAYQKYPELADYQTYLNDQAAYNAELKALTPAQRRLAEIKNELPKAPKAYHNQAILEDVGLPDTFYDDVLAQGLELQKRSVPSVWEKILDFQYGGAEKAKEKLTALYEPSDKEIHPFGAPFVDAPELIKNIETLKGDVEALKGMDLSRPGAVAKRAWKMGQITTLYAIEMSKEMMNQPNQAGELKALLDDPLFKKEVGGGGFLKLFNEVVEGSVSQTPRYYEAASQLIKGSFPIEKAENIEDWAKKLFAASPYRTGTSLFSSMYFEMAGAAYAGQLEAGIPENIAKTNAAIQGFIDSGIEFIEFGAIANVAGKIGKAAMSKIGSVALKRVLATVGGAASGYVSEINEEILQEMNAILWEEIGKAVANKAYGTDLQSQDFNEIKSRLFGTTLEAAKALVPTALGATISSFQKASPRVDMDVATAPGTDPKAVDAIKKVKAGVTLTESEAAMFAPGKEANRQTFENATGITLPEEAAEVAPTIEAAVQEQQAKAGAAPAVEQEKDLGAPEAPGEQATVKAAQGETEPTYRVKKTGAAPDVQRASTATKGRVILSPITYPDVTLDEKEVEQAAKSALKDAGINTRRSVARQFVDELVSAYKAGEMDKFDERLADKSKELAAYAADHVNLATEEDYSVYNAVVGKEYYIPERYVKSSRKGYEADLTAARRQLHGVVKMTTDRANGAVGIDTIADEIKSITGVDVGDSLFEIVEGLSDIVNRVQLDRARKKGMAGDYSAALKMTDADRAAELRTRAIERFAETGRTFEAKDREIDKESLGKLANEMARENKNKVPVTVTMVAAETKRQQFIVKFAETLGLDVVYYKNTGKAQRNEFFDPENPSTIFINVNAPVLKHGGNYEWIFGHGLFHALDAQGLVNDLRDFWVNEVYSAQEDAEMRGQIIEDLADNLGNAMADPAFWAQMRNYSPSLFNKIAEVVQSILEKIKRFLGRKDMEYVTLADQSLADFREKMAGIIQSIAEAENDVVEAMAEARLLYSDWDGMQEHMEGLIEGLDEDIAADEKAGRDTTQRKAARKAYQELLEEVRKTSLPKRLKRQVERLIEYRTIGATSEKAEIRAKMDQEFRDIKAADKARMDALKERLMGEMKQLKNETHRALQAMRQLYEDRRKADRELLRERFRVNAKRAQLRHAKTAINTRARTLYNIFYDAKGTPRTGSLMLRGKILSESAADILKSFVDNVIPVLRERKYTGKVDFGDLHALLTADTVQYKDAYGNLMEGPPPRTDAVLPIIEDLQGTDIKNFDEDDMRHLDNLVKWLLKYPEFERRTFAGNRQIDLGRAREDAAVQIEKEHPKDVKSQDHSVFSDVKSIYQHLPVDVAAKLLLGTDQGAAYDIIGTDPVMANRVHQKNLLVVDGVETELLDRLKKTPELFTAKSKDFITVDTSWVEQTGKKPNIVKTTKTATVSFSEGEAVWVSLNALNARNRKEMMNGGKVDFTGKLIPRMDDAAIDEVNRAVENTPRLRWWRDTLMDRLNIGKEWGNEASLKVYNFEVANEPNYYPIQVDGDQFPTQAELHSGTLAGIKMYVTRKGSSKPFLAKNPIDTVLYSLRSAARYNAYLLPLANIKQFLFEPQMRNAVRAKTGPYVIEYYQSLVYDLDYGRSLNVPIDDQALAPLQALRKNAIVGMLNDPLIALRQFGSYPLAAAVIEPKYLLAALPMPGSKNDTLMLKEYAPSIYRRRVSGALPETAQALLMPMQGFRNFLRKGFKESGVLLQRTTDVFVTGRIFQGAKMQVRAQMRKQGMTASANPQEYWTRVGNLIQTVAERTQSNSEDVLRSGLGRSKNELVRTLKLFTVDLDQMVRNSVEGLWDMKHGHKGRGVRKFASVVAAIALNVALSGMIAGWRRTDDDETDNKGLQFLLDFMLQVISMNWIGRVMVDAASGFAAEHIGTSVISDFSYSLGNVFRKAFSGEMEADDVWPTLRPVVDSALLAFGGVRYKGWEKSLVLGALSRIDWRAYDTYSTFAGLGIESSDYYPFVEDAAKRGDTAELQQLADVLAHYTADKIKAYNKKVLTDPEASKPREKSYQGTDWYREAAKTVGGLEKYQAFEEAYQTALTKWLGKP